MQRESSDRPDHEPLRRWVNALLEARAWAIEFVVLFGSRAKGNWSPDSDYDLLIGLREDDGRRLVDRMAEFQDLVGADVEVFPYARSEWQRMFRTLNPLLLDALAHGVVLYDRGGFGAMRALFQRWREQGLVVPWGSGWRIAPELEALTRPGEDRPEPAG